MNTIEIFVGVSELAIALAGFTGIVVAFSSNNAKHWLTSDRLRLSFLLESSLTAAGFSLLALLGLSAVEDKTQLWAALGALWAVCAAISLLSAHFRMKRLDSVKLAQNKWTNRIITVAFLVMISLQIANLFLWQQMSVFLGALMLNLAGAAMQFVALINSTFNGKQEPLAEVRKLHVSTSLGPAVAVADKTA